MFGLYFTLGLVLAIAIAGAIYFTLQDKKMQKHNSSRDEG